MNQLHVFKPRDTVARIGIVERREGYNGCKLLIAWNGVLLCFNTARGAGFVGGGFDTLDFLFNRRKRHFG